MPTVSPSIDERTRKNLSVILRALASVGQVTVADRMGVHESTVSRFKDNDFTRIAAMIAACGLKVVPESEECYAPGYLESLRHLLSVELARKVPTSGFGGLDGLDG